MHRKATPMKKFLQVLLSSAMYPHDFPGRRDEPALAENCSPRSRHSRRSNKPVVPIKQNKYDL